MRRKAGSQRGGVIQTTGVLGLVFVLGSVVLHVIMTPNKLFRSYLKFITSSSSAEVLTVSMSNNKAWNQSQSNEVYVQHPSFLIIDVISVGSKTRQAYQDAQQKTFGSSIRHFFRITEDDDVDQECHLHLTEEDAYEISKFCRHRRWGEAQFVMRHMRRNFAGIGWLNKKANPAGWMCAQRRSVHGFAKAIKFYRDRDESLPDYLIIMDDDTFYNMDRVSKYLSTFPTSEALALSGCMFRIPIHEINFTFPFGGWGLIYNRAALTNLLRPIRCNELGGSDSFLQSSCKTIEIDQILEREVFRDGMSVAELAEAYVSWQPYSQYRNWSKGKGFCLHGDWIWGYISNFYPISVHDPDPLFQHVPHARLQAYKGANNDHVNQLDPRNLTAGGQCNRSCTIQSHICHYQTPSMMERWKTTLDSINQTNAKL